MERQYTKINAPGKKSGHISKIICDLVKYLLIK